MSQPRISLRRGDRKKPPQKYKNSYSFKHNKNSRLTKRIARIDTKGGLCQRCSDILEWRKKYRKYKYLKKPRNCVWCKGPGTVKMAYHKVCWQCATARKACPKCLEVKELIADEVYPLEIHELEDMLQKSQTSERQKRMIRRKWEDGSLTDNQVREALRRINEAQQKAQVNISIQQRAENDEKNGDIASDGEYYGAESDDDEDEDDDEDDDNKDNNETPEGDDNDVNDNDNDCNDNDNAQKDQDNGDNTETTPRI